MAGQQALRAADFLNSLGVNTHVWERIDSVSSVEAETKYLGISSIRESAKGSTDTGALATYHQMAQAGLKFDLGVPGWNTSGSNNMTTADLQDYVKFMEEFAQQNPGSLVSITGFNEVNNWHVNYNGQVQGDDIYTPGGTGSYAAPAAAMTDFYNMVKASPTLKNIPVYDLTSGNYGLDSHAVGLDTIKGHADVADIHVYPTGTGSIIQEIQAEFGREYPGSSIGSTPTVITEFGYTTSNVTASTARDVDAERLPGCLQSRRAKSFAYVISDESNWPGFGLFQSDQSTPNPVGVGIHNLTTILSDAGAAAKTFTSGSLNYSLSGMPSQGQSMLMQKSSGAFDLALWNDGSSSSPVSVNLGGTYANVSVYDVQTGTTAIQTLHNVGSVSLNLDNDPTIVEVSGAPSTGGSGGGSGGGSAGGSVPGSSVLDLSLSEDAWNGEAQFTVSVDGKQVGGTMSAHALASTGASEHVKLTGNWSSGAHNVGISFLNDAYGGSAATDRNLHVNSIAFNGVKYANTSSVMFRNGTEGFKVGGSTPTAASDTNALTLHLSEDAYQGDAQFQVSVDGKTITSPDVVTALNSAGAVEDFTFTGLKSGSHDIGITFLNDAYAGTASTDRKLYVNAIDYGSHHFATNTAMMSSGTQHFTVS